jgi:small subunit ribosomal protein S1
MAAEYDAEGNYIYPEGFDPETQDWQEGYDKQREEWERQYAEAHTRYEQHLKQIVKAAEADAEAGAAEATGGNYSSTDEAAAGNQTGGTLASDEQLAALRERLSGGV